MFEKIMGSASKVPHRHGVNMAGCCIVDDEAVPARGRRSSAGTMPPCATAGPVSNDELVYKLELTHAAGQGDASIRPVIAAARVAEETGNPAVAIGAARREVVTGKTTAPDGATSATPCSTPSRCLAGIDHGSHLISPEAIEPIQSVKVSHLGPTIPACTAMRRSSPWRSPPRPTPWPRGAGPAGPAAGLRGPPTSSSSPWIPASTASWACAWTCEPTCETNKLYHNSGGWGARCETFLRPPGGGRKSGRRPAVAQDASPNIRGLSPGGGIFRRSVGAPGPRRASDIRPARRKTRGARPVQVPRRRCVSGSRPAEAKVAAPSRQRADAYKQCHIAAIWV